MRKTKNFEEKLKYCSEKIENLKSDEKLKTLIKENPKKSATKIISIYKKNWKPCGRCTKNYWMQRGWTQGESKYKARQNSKPKISPFSREYHMGKINPKTGKKYTISEADYKRNSYRPIRPEYWLEKGYNEKESIKLAAEKKQNNNIKGALTVCDKKFRRESSHRCKEYWMIRGYKESEAEFLVSRAQVSFSLQKCIEKNGAVEGYAIWKKRQEKWQDTLNNKSKEEIKKMNRKKRAKSQNHIKQKDGFLYLIKIRLGGMNNFYYKIGITGKSVIQRYADVKSNFGEYEIIKEFPFSIEKASFIENYVIFKLRNSIQTDHTASGYTEMFDISKIEQEEILEEIKNGSDAFGNI